MWRVPLPGGAVLVLEIETEKPLQMLGRRAEPFKNPRPFLEASAEIYRQSFRLQFQRGGIPPWQPLSPFTIAKKRGAGLPVKSGNWKRLIQNGNFGPENILIARGDLRDSYTTKGARGSVETFTEDSVEVGSNLPLPKGGKRSLASIHQHGAEIQLRGKTVSIPARPVVVQDEDRRKIVAAFRQFTQAGN